MYLSGSHVVAVCRTGPFWRQEILKSLGCLLPLWRSLEVLMSDNKRISDPHTLLLSKKAAKTAGDSGPNCTARSDASNPSMLVTVLKHAVSADKGTRTAMEDVHVCLDQASTPGAMPRVAHFAVYDGHGGSFCAKYVAARLHEAVMAAGLTTQKVAHSTQRPQGKGNSAAAAADGEDSQWELNVKAAKQAIVKGFIQTDELLLAQCQERNWQDGAAAVAVWIVQDTVLVANLGDAKCVLARFSDKAGSEGKLKALVLTKDHLAMYPAERSRIQKAGSYVTADGRLNGRIQVSRAFGDVQFKGAGSSAVPDVTAFSLCSRDQFMLCACDGFWGVMDPQGAIDLVQQLLKAGKDCKAITNRLLNEAVVQRRCKDNCTVLLIQSTQADTEAG